MNKLFSSFLLVIFTSSVCFAMPVFPTPSMSGATGLVRVPNANVIPYKNFNIAADTGTNPTSNRQFLSYKMNLGTFQGVEFGVVGGTTSTGEVKLREGVFVNMKLSLATNDEPYPLLLAIGVENLFSYSNTDVYMVATKYLQQGPKLTFGFMGDFPGDKFRPLGLAGIEFPLSGNNLVLVSDLLAGETVFQVNIGGRFFFSPTLCLYGNMLNVFNDDNRNKAIDPKTVTIGFSWANPF